MTPNASRKLPPSRCSQGAEGLGLGLGLGFHFGGVGISSLLFVDDVVLLVPSGRDLQLSTGTVPVEREGAGMKIRNLQIRDHGTQSEKGGMPSPGWE